MIADFCTMLLRQMINFEQILIPQALAAQVGLSAD